ncbi:antar domain protein [Rhodococcus sp. ABRD24]|uniref:antar domain protein n=1 Tax=Rhodococcus sp. ABRD24 TaxID=2507582 RepID=UPI00103B8BBA|nr:antar domain protein [Rhodococcus sp. ABRD24]QBJ97648.1 antar domain protein [Rhodococcus sp. ABRD24]
MYHSTIHTPGSRARPAGVRAPRDAARRRSVTIRARALEIVGILYRCDSDLAAELLMRHSQENNIRIASLMEGLVAVVDGTEDEIRAGEQTTLASHFWLREIRQLGESHRRNDRFERHVAAIPC